MEGSVSEIRHAPRVAIIGGGIGGLSAALFLRRAGVEATVYEQADEFREVGAGIVLTPNAVRLLRRLGLADALSARGVHLETSFEMRRWQDGSLLFAKAMSDQSADLYGEPSYVIHRADLHEMLHRMLPRHALRPSRRCVGIDEADDGVHLRFTDGRGTPHMAVADAVIGADGIHSVVRSFIAGEQPAVFLGLCGYRCLVPVEAAPEMAARPVQTVWLGPGRHFVHYPVSAGRLVNIAAWVPAGDWAIESWTADGSVEELAEEFGGWDRRVRQLIQAATETKRWALYDREPMECWTRGRVSLLGDAAHPMIPFMAQGANQAIEDAAALALCVRDAAAGDVPDALALYEQIRRPRASRVQQLSRGRIDRNHLPDGAEQQRRDAEFAVRDPLSDIGWLYGYDAEADTRRALHMSAS
jgi:salicylate hydroxylase